MRLDRLFLAFNLLLILVSIAAHEAAAEEVAFLLLTVLICAAVWVRANKGKTLVLNEMAATLVCLGAFLLMMFRGLSTTELAGVQLLDVRVPAVGEFLIIFQWVCLLRVKKPRDFFWIYLVSVVHMGTAGILMPGVTYGFFFVLYTLVAICTLTVYYIWAEVQTGGERAVRETRVNIRPVLAAVPVTLALMAPVALIFALLPRKTSDTPLARQFIHLGGAQPVAGFSRSVRLGEVGTIQDNPQRVMHVSIFDADTNAPVTLPNLLLRGIALDQYVHEGSWYWRTQLTSRRSWKSPEKSSDENGATHFDLSSVYAETFPGYSTSDFRRIRCDIALDPMDQPILFTPFAAESISGLPQEVPLAGNVWTHDLSTIRPWQRSLDYSVTARIFTAQPNTEAGSEPRPKEIGNLFLDLPRDFSPRVRTLAEGIVRIRENPSDYQKAVRILEYLSDSSRFAYTLRMDPTPNVEPVEDFLFNRHVGHCEYFASAMVLLCRCVGVPARLVNGFKVGEWNSIGGYYVVRQSNAHSWAEVYLHPGGWRTFDPSALRDAATPGMVMVRRWWRDIYDAVETLWVRNVLGYDAESQAGVYAVIRNSASTLQKFWSEAVARKMAGLVSGESLYKRTLRRFGRDVGKPLENLMILAMLAVAMWLAGLFLRWILRWWSVRRRHGPAGRFYQRMERLLAQSGYERDAAQTPWEFHREMQANGWPQPEPVDTITRAFCETRYGGRELRPKEAEQIEDALELIRLRKKPGGK